MDVFKTLILDTPDTLSNISGVLPVANGGTGANNAPDARVNLLPDYTGNANKVLSLNGTATDVEWTSNGAGDVAGPASSTDNAVARFDSTTGKVIQNSGVTISDANLLTADALSINNNTTLGSSNTDTVTFNARAASEFTPATDNTYDLGRVGHEWRDLFIDGTANIDSLVADTADVNGGTIDGATIGATTPSTGAFTTLSASDDVNFDSGTLFVDASADSVGIGTTSPAAKLDVNGSVNIGVGSTTGFNLSFREYTTGTARNWGIRDDAGINRLRFARGSTDVAFWDVLKVAASDQTGDQIWYTNGAQRMTLSSTGLAVTGGITTTGDVGIGTSTVESGFKLHVTGNGFFSQSSGTVGKVVVDNADQRLLLGSYYEAGVGQYSFISSTNNAETGNLPLLFQTGTTERMRIDASGNVGIGATTPNFSGYGTSNLSVAGVGTIQGVVELVGNRTDGTGFAAGDINFFANSNSAGNKQIAQIQSQTDGATANNRGGNLLFATKANNGSVTERMRIDNAGNVGIGTTSPSAKLDVNGNVAVTGALSSTGITSVAGGQYFSAGTSGVAAPSFNTRSAGLKYNLYDQISATTMPFGLGIDSGAMWLAAGSTADVIRHYVGTTLITTTSSTGLAVTGNIGAKSGGNIQLWDSANADYAYIKNTGSSAATQLILYYSAGSGSVAHQFMTYSGGVINALAITPAGNVGIGTTSPAYQLQLSTDSAAKPSTNTWTIASDSRIKNVTGEYSKGLDAVCALRPVTYQYNGKAGFVDDGTQKISIIAQEAIEHFPECVGTYKAKLEESDEQETELYNWNGHALTFALVNSVKELNAELQSLRARVAALELSNS